MPPDGAVMVNAVDIFKSSAPAPGEPPVLYGMPVPAAINAVVGIADAPFLDVVAQFKTEAPAQQWEANWPTVQRKLRTHPLLVLSGFSPLVTRARLEREGRDRAPAPRGVARRDAAPAGDGVALPHRPVRRRAAIVASERDSGDAREIHPRDRASGRGPPPPRRPPWTPRIRTPRPPHPPTKTARPPRRIFTYAILTGGALTLLAVLGVQRQSRARCRRTCRAPSSVAPLPRAPEPPDPLGADAARAGRRGRASSWCSRSTRPARCRD